MSSQKNSYSFLFFIALICYLPSVYSAYTINSLVLWTDVFATSIYILTIVFCYLSDTTNNKILINLNDRLIDAFYFALTIVIIYQVYVKFLSPVKINDPKYGVMLLTLYAGINVFLVLHTRKSIQNDVENQFFELKKQYFLIILKLFINIISIISLLFTYHVTSKFALISDQITTILVLCIILYTYFCTKNLKKDL